MLYCAKKIESGSNEVFEFHHELGLVYHLFIKKEILKTLENVPYYDLVTPYGNGGTFMMSVADGKKEQLEKLFSRSLQQQFKIVL